MIPNQKELDRIMDKCVDLVNDQEVNYLIDTIIHLQLQVTLFKTLYPNVSEEAEKIINQIIE